MLSPWGQRFKGDKKCPSTQRGGENQLTTWDSFAWIRLICRLRCLNAHGSICAECLSSQQSQQRFWAQFNYLSIWFIWNTLRAHKTCAVAWKMWHRISGEQFCSGGTGGGCVRYLRASCSRCLYMNNNTELLISRQRRSGDLSAHHSGLWEFALSASGHVPMSRISGLRVATSLDVDVETDLINGTFQGSPAGQWQQ